jgi:type IV pilus assembly protein PilV
MTPVFPARVPAHRVVARRAPAARALRGVSLVEALVALLMLMVGVLGVAAMQTALVAQVTTGQQRLAAQALADEILSLALVDERNASCYTWPAAGACTSGAALAALAAWRERANATLALEQDPVLALGADGELAVRLSWHGKDASHVHQLETRTHVLP